MEAPSQDRELHKEIERYLRGTSPTKPIPRDRAPYFHRALVSKPSFASFWDALTPERFEASHRVYVSEESSIQRITEQISKLDACVESMRQEIASHIETIHTLCEDLYERPITKQTQLLAIGDDLDVIQPIPIIIEEFTEEVIARFPEVEVYGVGRNEPEAISSLKNEIRDLYYDLTGTPTEELGKLPLSWLRILERLIRKLG